MLGRLYQWCLALWEELCALRSVILSPFLLYFVTRRVRLKFTSERWKMKISEILSHLVIWLEWRPRPPWQSESQHIRCSFFTVSKSFVYEMFSCCDNINSSTSEERSLIGVLESVQHAQCRNYCIKFVPCEQAENVPQNRIISQMHALTTY